MTKKNLIIIFIYLTIMVIFIIGSFLVNLPVIVLISVYALSITTLSVQYDHWILNSLSIPFTFTYTFALIQDFYDLNFLFAFFHIPTVICCYLIISRKNLSFLLMTIMSFVYALWIFVIKAWVYFPYYKCVFFICDDLFQSIIVFIAGLSASLFVSKEKIVNKIKIIINNKKKNGI